MIQIENLFVQYGKQNILENISLNLPTGAVCAVIGPSGCGKSTLLNVLAGLNRSYSGNVLIDGGAPSPKTQTIGFIPQNYGLLPWLKVRENIGFLPEGAPLYPDLSVRQFLNYMAELRGFYGEERDERVAAAEALAKVENVAQQKIETLSKGYSRRVGFAQSILSRPPVLLLDEPTDGLDPNQKRHIRSLISQMGKSRTIVISTHLLEEAESVCNRIVLVNKGRIMADGDLNEVLKQSRSRNLENAFRKLTTTEEEE